MTRFGRAHGLTASQDAELAALWAAYAYERQFVGFSDEADIARSFDDRTSEERRMALEAALNAYNAKRRQYERAAEARTA